MMRADRKYPPTSRPRRRAESLWRLTAAVLLGAGFLFPSAPAEEPSASGPRFVPPGTLAESGTRGAPAALPGPAADALPPAAAPRNDLAPAVSRADTSQTQADPRFAPSFPDRLAYCRRFGVVVCESDFPVSNIEAFETEILDLQTDLIDYLGVPRPNEKIGLCLFARRESYAAFLREVFPQAPTNRPALYIKDRGPGILFLQVDDRLIVNLRHEMTHAILNASLRYVPIWLDEGLAKYFETPRGDRATQNPFLDPVANRASSFLVPIPSLARLEKMTKMEQIGPDQYRDAWAWTHFLIHYSPETQRLLGRYLYSLRPENRVGMTAARAAEIQKSTPMTALLKEEMPDYKRAYKAHFEQWARKSHARKLSSR